MAGDTRGVQQRGSGYAARLGYSRLLNVAVVGLLFLIPPLLQLVQRPGCTAACRLLRQPADARVRREGHECLHAVPRDLTAATTPSACRGYS